MDNFTENGARGANSSAHIYTVADVAAKHNLKAQKIGGKVEYHGANPTGDGATKDGFFIREDGTGYDRNGTFYSCKQVAELAGINSEQYEPFVQWKARNGVPDPLPQTTTKGARNAVKSPTNGPFDWSAAMVYPYTDETGETLFEVGRTGDGSAKRISQRKPKSGGGYDFKLGDVRRVLYRLPEVLGVQIVCICEGEKAADALNKSLEESGAAGHIVATTNPHGAGKWKDEFAEVLTGKEVWVLPDNDAPGASHADTVCASCASAGATVKRIELTEVPHKGDVADFLSNHGGHATALFELADQAPQWTPPPPARRFPRFTLSEVFVRPRLEYLVQGMFVEIGTGVISADYGGFKSFVALDMGLCVATGRDWMNRATKRGNVVYITPEGSYQHADRVKAWMKFHHVGQLPENLYLIELPAQIGDASQCAALIDELRELDPALIILDTVAKCNIGRDENDAAAMGLFTDGMEKIARELGAFVLAIHHNNKNGTARGSVSLPANVDASITLRRSPNRIVTIGCDRVKGAPFEPFSLVGNIVETGEADENGAPITSLVFTPTDTPATVMPQADQTREKVFEALCNAGNDGLTASQWQEKTGLGRSSFSEHCAALRDAERVQKDGRNYKVAKVSGCPAVSETDKTDDKFMSVLSGGAMHRTKRTKPQDKIRRTKNDPNSEPYHAVTEPEVSA